VRALIATWHWKARADVPEPVLRSLVAALCQPPRFRLPPATTAHTRHYMPTKGGDKTKVFDTFIQLAENAPLLVAWNVDLPAADRAALHTLAERLGYFGRAESLVEARLLDGITGIVANAEVLAAQNPPPKGAELVRLLAPMSADDYANWRNDFLATSTPPAATKKKPGKKVREAQDSPVPPDMFAALHADTGDLQAAGWNLPPGAQCVNYSRPENAFAPSARPRLRRGGSLPTVARFALTSVMPPSITKALAVGEQIHTVLCKASDGHAIFTGAGGAGHQHAHIFCESIGDSNAHITHVTVFAEGGFDEPAVAALRSIQWTWGFKGHDLRLVLHGIGTPADFPDCTIFAKAKVWRSLTPFVSTRHAKAYRDGRPKLAANGWQDGSAPHDLLRLLDQHLRGQGAEIRCLKETTMSYPFGQRRFRSLQFLTHRPGGKGSRGHDSGAAFEISFPEPRPGPFALGYGAHFGLGLFVPVASPAAASAPQPRG
jgi:CRISPR-associated protein Csb2